VRAHPRLAVLSAIAIAAPVLLAMATPAAAAPPLVLLFSPPSGPVGTSVVVTGSGFDDDTPATSVKFNTTSATFVINSNIQITATVPVGATSGPISVTDAAGTSSSLLSFNVTPPGSPLVALFVPISGPVGTSVTITGDNFTGATAVTFNGTSASFSVQTDLTITATVPAGATTGPIAVTTPGGTAAGAVDFTVTAAGSPVLVAFTPTSGHAGTTVQITGASFTGATAVTFNGTSASFSVDSDTQITATVPAGATTGPIEVTTPSGTATSAIHFTVTDAAVKHARAVTLRTRGRLTLVGRVRVKTGFDACAARVDIVARRRGQNAWRRIATDTTNGEGRYRIQVPGKRGSYQVVAPRHRLNDDLDVCQRDVSPTRRWPS
jgi:hypothetical protein